MNIAPLYIQVIIDRQRKLVATGVSVPTSAWDSGAQRIKRTYPQASSLRLKLDTQAEDTAQYSTVGNPGTAGIH